MQHGAAEPGEAARPVRLRHSGAFNLEMPARGVCARACAVREVVGLKRGTVLHKVDPMDGGPDVTWQCEYTSIEERERDLKVRADSSEFEEVRKHMRTCYDRFDRHFEEVVDS